MRSKVSSFLVVYEYKVMLIGFASSSLTMNDHGNTMIIR